METGIILCEHFIRLLDDRLNKVCKTTKKIETNNISSNLSAKRGLAMQCRNCHKELKEHARFCAECGTPVPLEPQANLSGSHGAVGTRDQSKSSSLVYPKNPPLSPHL